jgi:pimeloyl-ACP methyl ester carboxylesterase
LLDPELQFVKVSGLTLAYRVSGDADKPPMVLLHGMAETSAYFWRGLITHFERDYYILAFDLLGHGDSSKPIMGYEYSIPQQARLLCGALDALGLSQVVLIGHSLGGIIAARLCANYPDRVRSLVLYDVPLPSGVLGAMRGLLPSVPARAWLPVSLLLLPGAAVVASIVPFRTVIQRLLLSWGIPHKPETMHDELLDQAVRNSRFGIAETLPRAFLLEDVVRDLHKICARTLVIVGDNDVVVPLKMAEDCTQRISGARMVVIEQAGHVALIDQPEQFNSAVAAFLQAETL